MATCPTCGDEFDTSRGMKSHHAHVHGEEIGGVEYECANCGETGRKKPYLVEQSENNFCSNKCANTFNAEAIAETQKNRIECECENCGDVYEEIPARIDRTRFCSASCRSQWVGERIEPRSGEDHPYWKGGFTKWRGENWRKKRQKARKYDGHRCQRCGVVQEDHWRALDVHHIEPYYESESDEAANDMGNLTTLCSSCHPIVERSGVLF